MVAGHCHEEHVIVQKTFKKITRQIIRNKWSYMVNDITPESLFFFFFYILVAGDWSFCNKNAPGKTLSGGRLSWRPRTIVRWWVFIVDDAFIYLDDGNDIGFASGDII